MITRRQLLAITIASTGLSATRIPLLPAKPIELPAHEPSAGFSRKLWIALGDGEEIEHFGRQPVTFRVDESSMISNETAVYFTVCGPDDRYEVTSFHLFDERNEMLFEGRLVAALRISGDWRPQFGKGALEFNAEGFAQA